MGIGRKTNNKEGKDREEQIEEEEERKVDKEMEGKKLNKRDER